MGAQTTYLRRGNSKNMFKIYDKMVILVKRWMRVIWSSFRPKDQV